jgi:ABC-type branched-subunit amino acid transport system ATPase component
MAGLSARRLPELVIPAGAIAALIGPNGSGKSTRLNLLTFMSAPDTGMLTFF